MNTMNITEIRKIAIEKAKKLLSDNEKFFDEHRFALLCVDDCHTLTQLTETACVDGEECFTIVEHFIRSNSIGHTFVLCDFLVSCHEHMQERKSYFEAMRIKEEDPKYGVIAKLRSI